MPVVAIPIAVALVPLLIFALRLALLLLVVPAAEAINDHIPVVGKYFLRGVTAIIRALTIAYDAIIARTVAPVVAFLFGLADVLRELPDAVADFATKVEATFSLLVGERIPEIVRAMQAPLLRGIDAVEGELGRLGTKLAGFQQGIEGRVRQLTEQMWERAINPVVALAGTVIPNLRRDLLDHIDRLRGDVGAIVAGRLAPVEAGLTNLNDYVRGKLSAETLRNAAEIAATTALIATVVMPAVNAYRKCSRKLGWLCTTDDDLWDDVMGNVIPFIGLAAVVAMAEEMVEIADSAAEGIAAMLDG